MREAGVVLNKRGQPIFWHVPVDRTAGSIPDDVRLWDVLWENRHDLSGFAHSHPGSGPPAPSHTDVTTFAAVEQALGLRLDWWITTDTHVALFRYAGPKRHNYTLFATGGEPAWVPELRMVSESR